MRLRETEGRGVLGGSAPLGYPCLSHRSFFGGRWQQWSCLDRKLWDMKIQAGVVHFIFSGAENEFCSQVGGAPTLSPCFPIDGTCDEDTTLWLLIGQELPLQGPVAMGSGLKCTWAAGLNGDSGVSGLGMRVLQRPWTEQT